MKNKHTMHQIRRITAKALAGLSLVLALGSCIRNDIPYPTIQANFTTFDVRGAISTKIDSTAREVTVDLADTVDIKKVFVTSYELTDKATVTPEIGEYIDLSEPLYYTLSIYQDYLWTIRATQTIVRAFTVEGQAGAEVFDLNNHSVVAYVPMNIPLNPLKITKLLLGPSNSTITPDPATVTDFTHPQTFTVKYRDVTEEWKVIVQQTEKVVSTVSADGWPTIGWFKGMGLDGGDNGFEYRLASASEWTKVNKTLITSEGTSFSAKVPGLTPATDYVCRAYSDGNYGAEIAFTTDALVTLTDASFDDWFKNGKIWQPWAESAAPFWGTGNKGATTIGESNSTPDTPRPNTTSASPTPHSAKLESVFAGIGPLGKFAAGNIFSGDYRQTDGTNGILGFGRPYASRPTRLEGWYKYTSKPIDYVSESMAKKGDPDTCVIYIALTDWTEQLEIRTKPSNRQLFDKKDPKVIAYGELASGKTVGEWTKFSIPLQYNATDRKPKYILVVGTASKYGDYFTGGKGSTLWIDDLELKFD